MTPKQFFDTVCAMREAQKKFFKSHSSFELHEAKRLEKIIDTEIERVRKIIDNNAKQPTLFNQ